MESQAEQQLRQTVQTVALQAASAISGKENGLPAPDIHLQEVSSPRSARRVWRVQILQNAETMVVEVKQHTQRKNAEWETSILRCETQPTGIYLIEGQVMSGLYRGAPRALMLWRNRQKVGGQTWQGLRKRSHRERSITCSTEDCGVCIIGVSKETSCWTERNSASCPMNKRSSGRKCK